MEAYPSRDLHLEPRSLSCGGKGGPEMGPKGAGRAVSPGQAPGSTQAAGRSLPAPSLSRCARPTHHCYSPVPPGGWRAPHLLQFFVSQFQAPGAGFRREQQARLFLLDVTQRLWWFQAHSLACQEQIKCFHRTICIAPPRHWEVFSSCHQLQRDSLAPVARSFGKLRNRRGPSRSAGEERRESSARSTGSTVEQEGGQRTGLLGSWDF